MRPLGVLMLCVPVLLAQPDPRELVRQSIRNGERSWRESFSYACTQRDVTRQIGDTGHVKQKTDDVYEVIPLGYNTSFSLLISHNNEPIPAAQMARQQRELAKVREESPAEKERRFQKLRDERSYMLEVPDAFDFQIVGEQNLDTGPAWMLDAEPRPGYQARTRYGKMFHAMKGRLWIDRKDVQWVKADAVAMEDVSFGLVIARLSKGSHIVLEQEKLPDGAWVPKEIQAKANARLFLFFNHNFEEQITFSDYHKPGASLSASRGAVPLAR